MGYPYPNFCLCAFLGPYNEAPALWALTDPLDGCLRARQLGFPDNPGVSSFLREVSIPQGV